MESSNLVRKNIEATLTQDQITQCRKRIEEMHPLRQYKCLRLFPSVRKIFNICESKRQKALKMKKPVLKIPKMNDDIEANKKKLQNFLKGSLISEVAKKLKLPKIIYDELK